MKECSLIAGYKIIENT